ncbi:YJL084C [Saccharomyces arboricola H-6]|uniref:YJL084C n=1 Tax=Saccharomyces arboricola (strain H-6 / AS 2.3317 / CBS 10644) TaxID=1160507 RepID=J8LM58_SACAR|nr:YJL084C [Saccharomyces arboricola H-6]
MPADQSISSPLFPMEKDIDVPLDATPLAQSSSLQLFIHLAEPVVFLQGFDPQRTEYPSVVLRGCLVVRILKPTKLKSINLSFKGYSRTEWPEGIPPKRQEFVEIKDIVDHTWALYPPTEQKGKRKTNVYTAKDGNNACNNFLMRESGASLYRTLSDNDTSSSRKNSLSGLSSLNLSPLGTPGNSSINVRDRESRQRSRSSSITSSTAPSRNLSPINLLKRATSPSISHHNHKPTTTSIFSDLLNNTFTHNDSASYHNHHIPASNSHLAMTSNNYTSGSGGEFFVFQPGDYVYAFEELIPQEYPESVKADFGFVEYFLFASIERPGAFKSNISGRQVVDIVRTQAHNSVEESEPIIISRDWENQLYYDIVIASKDIILDAFLPITFKFAPLDKVTLHRIRIYVTETMEYYCRDKKVHRMEPTKKFLLTEQKGPRLANLSNDANSSKAKNMGNLLEDSKNGDLVNKEYEYQIFIPSRFNNHQQLHPDTSYENIKANHWIKMCLRLSRVVDNKRKHYEISIDSPIHVLHRLCSHANTLLPSYDGRNTVVPKETDSSTFSILESPEDNTNLYHNSNIFFPKEILSSPVLSPNVQPLDILIPHLPSTSSTRNSRQFIRNSKLHPSDNAVFHSAKLKSNIYQPEILQRELASPQAIPLSPITSPVSNMEIPPPDFDFSPDYLSDAASGITTTEVSSSDSSILPKDPPSYKDAMLNDNDQKRKPNSKHPTSPPLKGSSSNKHLNSGTSENQKKKEPTFSMEENKHKKDTISKKKENKDVKNLASSQHEHSNDSTPDRNQSKDKNRKRVLSLSSSLHSSPNNSGFAHSALGNLSNESLRSLTKRESVQGNLPCTVRHDNPFFTDLNQILIDDELKNYDKNELNRKPTNASSTPASARSSFDYSGINISKDKLTMEPLLSKTETLADRINDDSFLRPNDSYVNLLEPSVDTTVDITAPYARNSSAWHPSQNDDENNQFSPLLGSNENFLNLINAHSSAESDHNNEKNDITTQGSGLTESSRNSDSEEKFVSRSSSPEKLLINTLDDESGLQSINESTF